MNAENPLKCFLLVCMLAELVVVPGAYATITLAWDLTVNSVNAAKVTITSSNGYGGVTNYTVLAIPNKTPVNLQAPTAVDRRDFRKWTGCDNTSGTWGEVCDVTMTRNKLVKAVYWSESDDFVTTWQTDGVGTSDDFSVSIPMIGGPFDIDWDGDETFDEFGLSGTVTHTYATMGTKTIRIRGTYDSIRHDPLADNYKLITVEQWGTNAWTTMESAFKNCANLTVPATDTPNFSSVTSMKRMFYDTAAANPNTSSWDTSSVTDMSYMFYDTAAANPNTSSWDTSSVTDMSYMFRDAYVANPNTSSWDTSSVTNMRAMFNSTSSANPNTSSWNTSSVTDMSFMFSSADVANPDVSTWDTSSVTDMSFMFFSADVANPDTSNWDTSSVTDMSSMFRYADFANPDTSNWNTSSVTDMSEMFSGADIANPDVSGWDTAKVTDMHHMFLNATAFDQNLGSWDVGALTNAGLMLNGVTLSTFNYDSLLIGWGGQILQTGVNFHAGNSHYCSDLAVTRRTEMVNMDTWTITDAGQDCPTEACNDKVIPAGTINSSVAHSACDTITVSPLVTVTEDAYLEMYGGEWVDIIREFNVEQGGRMTINVCGQSLCAESTSPMRDGCHPCVDLICDLDPACCITAFDSFCLDYVDTVCGLVCE